VQRTSVRMSSRERFTTSARWLTRAALDQPIHVSRGANVYEAGPKLSAPSQP